MQGWRKPVHSNWSTHCVRSYHDGEMNGWRKPVHSNWSTFYTVKPSGCSKWLSSLPLLVRAAIWTQNLWVEVKYGDHCALCQTHQHPYKRFLFFRPDQTWADCDCGAVGCDVTGLCADDSRVGWKDHLLHKGQGFGSKVWSGNHCDLLTDCRYVRWMMWSNCIVCVVPKFCTSAFRGMTIRSYTFI